MYRLAFDVETTGLIQRGLPDDHPLQPRLLQLGVLLLDGGWVERAAVSLTVLPDGWEVPVAAAGVHGITTELARGCGVPVATALSVFTNLRARADELVAHNLAFDAAILRAEVARTGRTPAHPGPDRRACTMELARPVLRLPPTQRMLDSGFGPEDYKSPSLKECYEFLFPGEEFAAHDALVDARAAARIYRRLLEIEDAR